MVRTVSTFVFQIFEGTRQRIKKKVGSRKPRTTDMNVLQKRKKRENESRSWDGAIFHIDSTAYKKCIAINVIPVTVSQ
jgi:hypothetical protein